MDTFSIKHIICISFLSIFTAYASMSHAASPDSIGTVVWVKNIVQAEQPNTPARTLTRHSAIYEHDTLKTDNTSTGEVIFTDDSRMTLRENSMVTIDQYRHGKETSPSQDTFIVSVLKGGFRTVTGAISQNNPGGYKANTAVATIGVMGTDYSIYFDSIKKKLSAKLYKGSIVISNDKGQVTLVKCSSSEKKGTTVACVNKLNAEVDGDTAPLIITNESSDSGLVGSFCIN